ncbi:hypothetical protein Bca52824_047231 [Brassica carinata]|uniref:Uncharacterized protein n=1 Tax=Brassica carinata TaxID=52824 RepID=A0A8X7UR20_BRACI|nr:hypothetical protein Bca52824_047231 [Brassica carinata]
MIEQPHKKRCLEENPKDIIIDAVLDNGEDVALNGGDSDSDGYLDENLRDGTKYSQYLLFLFIQQSENKAIDHPMQVVDETRTDTMKRKLMRNSLLKSLTSLLNWYRAACHYGHEPSGITKPDICYEIEDSETFAKVMIFVLQKADHTFRSILGLSGSSNKEKILKLKNNPKWDSVKPLIKSFFRSTIRLVKQAADLEITCFFAAFPELLKKLIKTLSKQAFLILKNIGMVFNSECFDTCFINMYKAFLHDCDIPKENSQQRLQFLRDSLVEMCSQDMQKSYTKAFVSITQLAKLLKMSMTTKNKEAVEKIHSGHYTNCLDLWVIFIGANVQDYDLQPVKCIQWLNHLSRTSGIFIPIASLVMDMLEYKTTNDGEKQAKKLEAVSTLKLPKNWLKSQNFQEQCTFSVIELLAVHFAQWSFHISFPEVATIPIMRLKKFNESSTMEGLKRVVKRFIEQVEMNIEYVQMKRDEAAFSPNDQQSIETFFWLRSEIRLLRIRNTMKAS